MFTRKVNYVGIDCLRKQDSLQMEVPDEKFSHYEIFYLNRACLLKRYF